MSRHRIMDGFSNVRVDMLSFLGKGPKAEKSSTRYLSKDEKAQRSCSWPKHVQQHTVTLLRMLKPYEAIGVSKIRVGGDGDGGYVMLDDFAGIETAFSLGVGPNVDWDFEVAERGLTVHQFDHTVDGPPRSHERFRFHKKAIVPEDRDHCETLRSIMRFAASRDPASTLLKMDIENQEWEVFAKVDPNDLRCFSQILCEFHAFEYFHQEDHARNALLALQTLKPLFEVVHIHANNVADVTFIRGSPVPFVLEVTLVNRERYDTCVSEETFPTALDRTNDVSRPDYDLRRFEI